LKRKINIQKVFAAILLLLFTVSSAPTVFFHDAFADHKDAPSCSHPYKSSTHLHTKTPDCHFSFLVSAVPFYLLPEETSSDISFLFKDEVLQLLSSSTQIFIIDKDSRGPPVI